MRQTREERGSGRVYQKGRGKMQGDGVPSQNMERSECSVKKLHLKGKPQEGAAAQSILDFPEVQGENFHKTGNTIYL